MTLLKMDSAAQFYFRYQQWPLSLPCIYMAGSGYYAYRMANSFGTLWGKICFFEREQTITIRCQEKLKQVIYLWGTCCNWLFGATKYPIFRWLNAIKPHFHFHVTTMLGTKVRKNRQIDIELGCLRELPNLKWHHSTDHGVGWQVWYVCKCS